MSTPSVESGTANLRQSHWIHWQLLWPALDPQATKSNSDTPPSGACKVALEGSHDEIVANEDVREFYLASARVSPAARSRSSRPTSAASSGFEAASSESCMPIDRDAFDEFLGTIQRFVRERLIPNEARVAEDDAIPDDIVEDMKSLGLFGLAVPEDYGGLDLSMEEEVLVILEIARASPAFRSYFATNVGIGSQAIVMDGTDEQKRRYLPRLASGEIIGSFALTEPNSGSDAASLQTTAWREGEFYVLNGTKRFITNAPEAGVFTVMARTDLNKKGADAISAFVIDRDTPGLTVGKAGRKMGQRGAQHCRRHFRELPCAEACGDRRHRGPRLQDCHEGPRQGPAEYCGSVHRCRRAHPVGRPRLRARAQAVRQAHCRVPACPGHARRLPDRNSRSPRSMILEAARKRDRGGDVTMEASCCKLYASEMGGRVADRAVQIHGGAGYMAEYAVERFYRDVRLFRIYEGTSQIQQIVIARNMIRKARAEA